MTAPGSVLYTGATVRTMDAANPVVSDFLVEGGVFRAVGADARERAGAAEVVDLGGRTVVPGLIDAHAHLETSAVSSGAWVDVRDVPNAELLDRLVERARTSAPGEWIIGQATFSQAHSLPGRWELDAAVPQHPVVLRASMHAFSANSPALERAGLLSAAYAPTGTVISRDDDGRPDGQLLEAFHLFPIDLPSVDDTADLIERELRDRFTRFGVTSLYEVPMSQQGMRAFQQLDAAGRLRARVALFPAVRPGLQPLVDDIAHIAAMGLASGFGNDRLWLGGAKFFLDSVYDQAFWPGRDVDHPSRWGTVTHLYSDVVRALAIGYEAGIQTWFHAVGLGAQQLVIDAAAEAQRNVGGDRGLRTRIEHIFNERPPTPDMLEGLRAANIVPVPNAVFLHIYDDTVGSFPYRTLLEEGFRPPGNSDNSGTQPFACNPWFGIGKLRTRRNRHGVAIEPDQQISVHDALRTYTEFGAYAGHREGRLGVIRAGALADFAVLNADPYAVSDEDLFAIESDVTVVGGETVWDAATMAADAPRLGGVVR